MICMAAVRCHHALGREFIYDAPVVQARAARERPPIPTPANPNAQPIQRHGRRADLHTTSRAPDKGQLSLVSTR